MADAKPILIDLLDSPNYDISGDDLDNVEEEAVEEEAVEEESLEEEDEVKQEVPGMPGVNSKPANLPITNSAATRDSPNYTVELDDQHLKIQYAEELSLIDAEINNVGLTELEGANNLNV